MAKGIFNENVVVITGASSGIGAEMAFQLATQGAWLALAARREERLKSVVEECLRRGGKAIAVPTDVSNPQSCEQLMRKTIEQYGRIDTLINNAGITMWAMFEDVADISIFEKIMRVNYLGSVYCTYYALPYLKQSRGRLVAVSSMTGKAGVPTRSGYAASKHAMVGFFDTLRIELAPYGISVTIIYPDFVATETRIKAIGADGNPIGVSPVREGDVMTAEECAQRALKAIARRRREDVQSLRGKVGLWLKLIAPQLVDRIALSAIRRGK